MSGEVHLVEPDTDEPDTNMIRRICDRRQHAEGQQTPQKRSAGGIASRVTGSRPTSLSGFPAVARMPNDKQPSKARRQSCPDARERVAQLIPRS